MWMWGSAAQISYALVLPTPSTSLMSLGESHSDLSLSAELFLSAPALLACPTMFTPPFAGLCARGGYALGVGSTAIRETVQGGRWRKLHETNSDLGLSPRAADRLWDAGGVDGAGSRASSSSLSDIAIATISAACHLAVGSVLA